MKKLLLAFIIILLFSVTPIQAQDGNARNGVSVSLIKLDHFGPYEKAFSFGDDHITNGAMISYHRNLVKNFLNLEIPVKIAGARLFDDEHPGGISESLVGLDALLQLQYSNGKNLLVPYLSAGLGGLYIEDGSDFQIPAGVGLDIRMGNGIFLRARTEYRFSFSENRDNWNHIFGIKALFGGQPSIEEPIEIVPTDTDGDGITDNYDKCPTVAGLAAMGGCPDADGDGVTDDDDECPTVAGLSKYAGCPDSDNDGIIDEKDNCPNEAGPASNNGCPAKDTDGDGVTDDMDDCPNAKGLAKDNGCPDTDGDAVIDKNDDCPDVAGMAKYRGCPDTDNDGLRDKDDKCPNTAGPISNNGCPELEEKEKEVLNFASKSIEFNTASATIKQESYDILNQVADILIKYSDYKCSISGHTDSQGNAALNLSLSEKRAKACYDYLVRKGVSGTRLTYAGYGETEPIADNKYEAGRKMNRRVVFNIYL